MIARGNQTDVVLDLSSGALQTEAVYIHQAPCGNETLGLAVYPLTFFVGGAGNSVTTLDVPLASLRTGEFAISGHANGYLTGSSPPPMYSDAMSYAGEPTLSTACGNIPKEVVLEKQVIKDTEKPVVVVKEMAKVVVVEHDQLGAMLTDVAGRSLYLLARDQRNVSTCTGICAREWPPLLTVDDPVAGDGVAVEILGTINRDDGSRQVTYDGRPLYRFAGDDKPGDTNGHDIGDVWFVVNPDRQLTIAAGR